MRVIIIILLVLFVHNIHAQTINKLKSNYEYKDEVYRTWQLREILIQDSIAYEYFDLGMKQQQVANGSGLVSLGLITTGAALILIPENNCESLCEHKITGFLFGVIAPIPGIAAIIAQISAKKKKNRAINHFNKYYGNAALKDQKINISIGTTESGLGLLVCF